MAIIIKDKTGKETLIAGAGKNGKSAYQVAVDNGFVGTEQEWLASLKNYPTGGLEGQALVKSSDTDSNVVKWGPWPSNPNLLINADFRQPVNRNEKTDYTAAGYTIDGWYNSANNNTVKIKDGYLELTSLSANYLFFSQKLNSSGNILDKQITLSLLTNDNTLATVTGIIGSSSTSGQWLVAQYNQGHIKMQGSTKELSVVIVVSGNSTGQIIATKLELGEQQTLAHQDTDGNWVLNDPPNYDLQYLLCSQYSPSTGEFVGSQHSNRNLLDNWYFGNPINQRGQTEYSAVGYTIDRWKLTSAGATVMVTPNGLIASTANVAIRQQAEDRDYYNGKTYTFSVLMKNGGLISISGQLVAGKKFLINCTELSGSIAGTSYDGEIAMIQLFDSDYAVATKLELGPVQTLAHKEGDTWVLNDPPPNYGQELAKCQRYQTEIFDLTNTNTQGYITIVQAVNATEAYGSICLPVSMRDGGNPSVVTDCTAQNPYKSRGIFSDGYKGAQDITSISVFGLSKLGVVIKVIGANFVAGNYYQVFVTEPKNRQLLFDRNL